MFVQNKYLILEEVKVQDKTISGIFLPSQIMDGSDTVAVSTVFESCSGSLYKKGQDVIFSKYIPLHFEHEGKRMYAIKEEDVIAIL